MKRVLDEDLRITMCQLDMEQEAIERSTEEDIERCYQLMQDLEQQLSEPVKHLDQDQAILDRISETDRRIMETLTMTDPERLQMDEFKNEQLLSLTVNLLLFIRAQVPVNKKLFQSSGDSVTYTDTWQDVPENPSRFDTTLNVISQEGFKEGRSYWEVQVSGKTYWELGLTYSSIPRKGREEQGVGRGPESWCVEYFNGDYTAWHNGAHPFNWEAVPKDRGLLQLIWRPCVFPWLRHHDSTLQLL